MPIFKRYFDKLQVDVIFLKLVGKLKWFVELAIYILNDIIKSVFDEILE